ncbi:glycosyltransferase family 4 protein [Rhodoplanes sp. Z2-YC6860]|uniref:glycosyltransferase family 4 protein n=1 Tax=Rhodoplanes sp. Z2-YC6860 TaxID=674703 RepID=UPI00078C5FD9|nr:glycosyltransferase family 4 protein [Rhodoplanes sp. Z2-YC6860]AMN40448.1 glycosyl transferase family protein [Rhodoplanes sp. Z2-YC6860]
MKIAQVAPLFESVPPQLYGGTERVVSYLTEELVRQGHEVTLFASGDSITTANLVSCCPRALRLDGGVRDAIPHLMVMLDKVRERALDFDVVHFHVDYFHLPFFRDVPMLTTLHGRQDLADHMPFYHRFHDLPFVSISDAQRKPLPQAKFVATVYHGLPLDLHAPNLGPPGNYLAFLGRVSPEKRPDRAIAIARAAGMPLKIAAKVDKADEDYFHGVIEPLLDGADVEFVGEINERIKTEFLGQAKALLFPIDWPEPFGLVMIEAMACGTPVLAFKSGSVPEIIDEGVTGRVVCSTEEALKVLPDVLALDRSAVRQRFEERFSSARMASDYVEVYRAIATRVIRPDPSIYRTSLTGMPSFIAAAEERRQRIG